MSVVCYIYCENKAIFLFNIYFMESLMLLLAEQVVEITKGSKVKYELDKKTGLIKVQTLVSNR